MTRRIKVTITAEAVCDDDRHLSRTLAEAVSRVAALDSVVDGAPPYVFDCVQHVADVPYWTLDMRPLPPMAPQAVRVTYVARFRWWHFLVPARFVRGSRDPLKWLGR